MNEKLKEALRKETAGVYPQEFFEESVTALGDFLFLISRDSKLKEENLLCMITGTLPEQQNMVYNSGNIETILKLLYRTAEPEKYRRDGEDKVKLEYLYKQVFRLVPEMRKNGGNFSIPAANPEQCSADYPGFRFISEFVRLYQFRNGDVTHSVDEIAPNAVRRAVTDTCVALLWLSQKYSMKLHKTALFEKFLQALPASWKKDCDSDYQAMIKKTGYVDFRWQTNDICSTAQIAFLDSVVLKNERYIKLLGQAGSGKTTALLNIKHLLLEKYEEMGLIPVFCELKSLYTAKDSYLTYIISENFSVPEEAAECLAETENLIFLLDGYNEILDVQIRRQFAKELEQYAETHKSVRVIMTDRNENNEITVLKNHSKLLRLRSLTDEDRREYFQKNCKDTKILKLLLDTLKENPVQFEMLTTPLKLYHFTQMTLKNGCVPSDFTAEYLQSLIERERDEKKDINLNVLEDYLKALTVLTGLENQPVEQHKALKIMADVDRILGYKSYNTAQALALARDMGILEEETRQPEGYRQKKTFYQFADGEYLVYYNELLYENEVLAENLEE